MTRQSQWTGGDDDDKKKKSNANEEPGPLGGDYDKDDDLDLGHAGDDQRADQSNV